MTMTMVMMMTTTMLVIMRTMMTTTPTMTMTPTLTMTMIGFQTDTGISGHSGEVLERELEKWVPDGGLDDEDGLHEFGGSRAGQQRQWDQFEANERLFGVTTDFKEEIYTTKLDKNSEEYRRREKEAARLAREIENVRGAIVDLWWCYSLIVAFSHALLFPYSHPRILALSRRRRYSRTYPFPLLQSSSSNLHIAEERGKIVDDSQLDEEDRYGAVIRKPGAYIPPALRKAESAKATTTGNPRTSAESVEKSGAGAPPSTKKGWAATVRSTESSAATPAAASSTDKPSATATKAPTSMKPSTAPTTATTTTATTATAEIKKEEPTKSAATASTKKEVAPVKEATAATPTPTKPAETPMKKSTLNPNAPAFSFNIGAAEFKPTFTVVGFFWRGGVLLTLF